MAAISQTPANVIAGSSTQQQQAIIGPGVTVVQGNAIYVDPSTGLAVLASANNGNGFSGIALTAGSPGQPLVYDASDWNVTLAGGLNIGATVSSGLTVWLSPTSGSLTSTFADISSGQAVIAVGEAYSDGTIGLNANRGGNRY